MRAKIAVRRWPDSPLGRCCKFVLLLLTAWAVFVVTHESGHLIGGCCSGGVLQQFDLRPWHLPYSFFQPDPFPLITLWCGPILGALLPFGFAVVINRRWAWFVGYFCLLANGAYLAAAWISGQPQLDTSQLLRHGSPSVFIALYCLATITPGYLGFRNSILNLFRRAPPWKPDS